MCAHFALVPTARHHERMTPGTANRAGVARSRVPSNVCFVALSCAWLLACDPRVSAVLPPLELEPVEPAGSIYAAAVQRTPGLAAYFRFSEPGGLTAVDRVGSYRLEGKEGASLGGEGGAIPDDPEQGAATFDGNVASRLSMAFPPKFQAFVGELSLELWVKLRGVKEGCFQPSDGRTKLIWVQGDTGAAWGLALAEEGALTFEVQLDNFDDPYLVLTTETVPGLLERANDLECAEGRWQHVVATFDVAAEAGNLQIYVDGQLTPSNGQLHPLNFDGVSPQSRIAGFEPDPRLDVGGSGAAFDDGTGLLESLGEPLDGSIDELAIYRRALTADEVAAHFEAASPE